jgi:CRISPR-associated endonuclease/helicase Cas3
MLAFVGDALRGRKTELLTALDLAAEFHDLGKLDDDIQSVLVHGRRARLIWDHMDAGIAFAMQERQDLAAWLIRAHHSPGLSSEPDELLGFGFGPLRGRRKRRSEHGYHDLQVARTNECLAEYLNRHNEACGKSQTKSPSALVHGLALRLLLSCLVDADHTDSAAWDGDQPAESGSPPDWDAVINALDAHVERLGTDGEQSDKNQLRSQFYCKAAQLWFDQRIIACEAGVGLGKTTSVTRHLLNYAKRDQLRHLFIVAPYTNILRQTAKTLREALGEMATDDFICENHHRAEFASVSARQYSTLWKAPVTLTTTVQFFETLASNRPASLRKLHELPGSVIFLDETHAALPATLWPQAWKWLQILTEEWNCRVVLASGSMIRFWEDQKVINPTVKLPELTPDGVMAANRANESARVKLETLEGAALNTSSLCAALTSDFERNEGPILCILNTVQSAAMIANEMAKQLDHIDPLGFDVSAALPDRKVLHLSTALSPSDRETILQEIEERKRSGRSDWILVATSCVEAGIDLDFQTGYRERCSVASLIQTSGRINRHGKRTGSVLYDFVIVADNRLSQHPAFKESAKIVKRMWALIISPDAVPAELVTRAMQLEIEAAGGVAEKIVKLEAANDYPAVADEFRIIRSDTRTVVVDPKVMNCVKNRECISSSEIMRHSVQLWSDRIQELGMEPVYPGSDLYVWNAPYDPILLGVMKGIIPVIMSRSGSVGYLLNLM